MTSDYYNEEKILFSGREADFSTIWIGGYFYFLVEAEDYFAAALRIHNKKFESEAERFCITIREYERLCLQVSKYEGLESIIGMIEKKIGKRVKRSAVPSFGPMKKPGLAGWLKMNVLNKFL